MENESVRSGRSERSQRSQHFSSSGRPQHHSGRHHNYYHRNASSAQGSEPERQRLRTSNRSDRETDPDTDREEQRRYPRDINSSHVVSMGGDESRGMNSSARHDDNWGETTTVVTGATSDAGYSMDDVRIPAVKDTVSTAGFCCSRYIGAVLAGCIAVIAFLSPIAMLALPKVGIAGWYLGSGKPECEGLLIGVAFKLLILAIGSWALFIRRPKSTMPRVFVFRAVVVFLTFVVTFAYWLFYGVRMMLKVDAGVDYDGVIAFATSLVDALLFVHYLAVILIEIRQMQPQYVIKITRSPDGETHSYTVGQYSIQRLAVWCLEQYYKDFQVYNPYLEIVPRKTTRFTEFKIYDVDGGPGEMAGPGHAREIIAAAAHASGRHRESGHNDRFYEEQEYERRVTRRRARLTVAAEEAFCHIKRMQLEGGAPSAMTAEEAAQAIFPTLARPLQKYLRVTRQQPRYTIDKVLEHLMFCIVHDMSAKAFLGRYLSPGPIIWNDKEYASSETWALVSDRLVSRSADDSTVFQLRQGDIVLLVVIRKLPHFNITEEVLDDKANKFVLRLNSESAV